MLVIVAKRTGIVKLLSDAGADVDVRVKHTKHKGGYSLTALDFTEPLYLCSASNLIPLEIPTVLIDTGANIHATLPYGVAVQQYYTKQLIKKTIH